jgi:hypothetical protein
MTTRDELERLLRVINITNPSEVTNRREALDDLFGLTDVLSDLLEKQEPLGAEFEAAIGDYSTLWE